jgi:catechol 2,3-dioxygenase-like lactoylglutathione lyase family enzyme
VKINASTISLTVDDVAASHRFFTKHLGYSEEVAAEGFAKLTREDAVDVVLLQKGIEVLPPEQRDQRAAGMILAFTVTGLEAEEERLRSEGAPITLPLREEPWGEKLFQLTDPNGVIIQLVEWTTPV